MRLNFLKASSLLMAGALVFTSCKKEDKIAAYTVPDTYDFDNVEYGDATSVVNMWSGFTSYVGKGTTRQLSKDTALFLWSNINSAFTSELIVNLQNTSAQLNSSALKLSDKTADPAAIALLVDSIVKVSQSNGVAASEGVAGKIGTRLFNYSGLEFNQLIAKGLMGAFQMKTVNALLDKTVADDNSTVIAGSGTAMQHDWDMAFGYTSLPKIYDSSITYANTVLDRPLAIGGYFRERGRFIKAGGTVHEAFRKGRAAIDAKDYAARNAAISTIKTYLEKTLAAAAYEYGNVGKSAGTVQDRFHGLSEGLGFILALKSRQAGSTLTEVNYQKLLGLLSTSFWTLDADASHTKINEAQAILAAAYGQLQP